MRHPTAASIVSRRTWLRRAAHQMLAAGGLFASFATAAPLRARWAQADETPGSPSNTSTSAAQARSTGKTSSPTGEPVASPAARTLSLRERIEGMLVGSLIGDAAGGPIEFVDAARIARWAPSIHRWQPDERLDAAALDRLDAAFQLLPYEQLRPEPAPYGPWTARAPAGTLTDDTRHKVIFMSALARSSTAGRRLEATDLARAYLDYERRPLIARHAARRRLCRQWLREQRPCCRWLLGERTPPAALPPQRLWGGLSTVMGQMVLLPVAAIHAGDPETAYKTAYRLGFFDNGPAKDINSAVIAGLAFALDPRSPALGAAHLPLNPQPAAWWSAVCQTMLTTDPYGYDRVPWVERPVRRWLGVAEKAVGRGDRAPAETFHALERQLMARTWWEAHTVFATVAAILWLCPLRPLAAMQLALEFGHDTDSTAQLLGAFLGAMGGPELFPPDMRHCVTERLKADEGESLDRWVDQLLAARKRHAQRVPIDPAHPSDDPASHAPGKK